jgi:hypothetical protein
MIYISRLWYGLGQLASNDDKNRVLELNSVFMSLDVTWTHGPRSYELEQLTSNDDAISDSYTYWVLLQRTSTFASILVKV